MRGTPKHPRLGLLAAAACAVAVAPLSARGQATGSAAVPARAAALPAGPAASGGAEYPLRRSVSVHAAPGEAQPRDEDLVVGVVVGHEARAYPVNLLWDESAHTVNDDLGGAPIAVALCPLAGAARAFDRRLGRETLDLGHVSETRLDTLVLYDARTHSRWGLLTGQAFEGPLAGRRLSERPSLFTTWARWKSLHPDTTLYVSPELAAKGYQLDAARIRKVVLVGDGPPRRGDWVVGLQGARTTIAVFVRGLAKDRVLNAVLDGRPFVLFVTPDLTTTAAWERKGAGRTLSFAADGERMKDAETGSSWDPMTGRALEGPLAGRALSPLMQTNGFWHAWKAHHPDTVVMGLPADATAPATSSP